MGCKLLSQKENAQSKRYESDHCFDVIYQTRETVFHWDVQTPRSELKYDVQRSIFGEVQDAGIASETLAQVFVISSQPKQKLRGKRRSNIFKIYAN